MSNDYKYISPKLLIYRIVCRNPSMYILLYNLYCHLYQNPRISRIYEVRDSPMGADYSSHIIPMGPKTSTNSQAYELIDVLQIHGHPMNAQTS